MAGAIEGKVPHKLLRRLLSRLTKPGREVIIGPSVGEDAFAVGVGRSVVVASTDPITFTVEHAGYYAVNVNANDVATMGARPRWFMATVLVPPGYPKRQLRNLFEDIDRTCVNLGVCLCGGHTEATAAVTRPLVVGAMLGTVPKKHLVRPSRVRSGDSLLVTKHLAIEGTAIIARQKKAEVEELLGHRGAARARRMLFSPGISVVREALCAVESAPVHAMHDPTEGGLIWGTRELCLASRRGLEVDLDKVPVCDETSRICDHFGLNPLGLIASGSLLIVISKSNVSRVRSAIEKIGVQCTQIGRVRGEKPVFLRDGKPARLPAIESDEITKIL
jgi:hydrogenase maturation factor